MGQDSKVVNLRGSQGTARAGAMAPALVRLRDASARSLETILGDFFDSADDALFNMADRAGSNQEQMAYFDAMRELRLRRKSLATSLLQWVSRAFNELGRFDPMPASRGLEEVSQESLTLMDDADLEQKVAIEGLITKLGSRYAGSIRLLGVRVAHVSELTALPDRQMPLSPEVICSGLSEACRDLDIEIRARLVVIKLFDKLLVSRLEALYQEANRLLIAEGVLPDMKRPPVPATGALAGARPRQSAPVPPAARDQTSEQTSGDSAVTFSELTALLHRDGGGDRQAGSGAGGAGGPILDTGGLMSRLGQLQPGQPFTESGQLIPLSALLAGILDAEQGQRYQVQQVDSDVINLVAMLFDFILEDRQLPALMKMLIGRLQIPVLKVALLDRSFFNRGGHPARKLLNELAMAGIGWTEKSAGQRDPLREKIESVVDRLSDEFTDNVELFGELLEDFSHFMDLDRRRRELVEQRLRDAEEGRARHDNAREQVAGVLAGLQQAHDIPEPVQGLLEGPWHKYLQWVLLRHGEDSGPWREARELTARLLWSLDPRPLTDTTRDDLLKTIPGVVDSLRAGLQGISWDPFAIDAAIRDLELAHVDVLQRLVTGPAEPATPVPQQQAPAIDPEPPVPASASVPDPAGVASGEPAVAAATAPEPVTEAAMARATRMGVGCWVEMTGANGKLRCKLAAVIRATGKYIFVNRNGAKVAEYRLEELARNLQQGRVTPLDDGLIFDRALESIIDNLRHSRRD